MDIIYLSLTAKSQILKLDAVVVYVFSLWLQRIVGRNIDEKIVFNFLKYVLKIPEKSQNLG